jgi:large subunit ribosomal protein L9
LSGESKQKWFATVRAKSEEFEMVLRPCDVEQKKESRFMEVILFENVKGLGYQGDRVKVSEGYFRNFLKPRGLAAEATPANIQRFEKMKQRKLELAAAKAAEAREIAKRIENLTVTIKAKAGESDRLFGSVTTQDVAEALAQAGYTIDRKHIEIDEPIKKLGVHTVTLRLHPEVVSKLKVIVERA